MGNRHVAPLRRIRIPGVRRACVVVAAAFVWLLLASEISDEENAPTLSQILGVAAWALLAALFAGFLLIFLIKIAIRILRRLVGYARTKWLRWAR